MKHTIEGKKFCITGTFRRHTHEGAQNAIAKAGGLASSSVGPGTDFLVAGHEPGAMLNKARTLGIPVIDEANLESLLAGGSVEVDPGRIQTVRMGTRYPEALGEGFSARGVEASR